MVVNPYLYGAPFTPMALSPAIWLDASQVTGYADGDPFTSWTDISGHGRHFTESTNPPTYKTNVVGTKPGILFDGTNDQLLRSYTGSGSAFTIVLVCDRSDTTQRHLWTNGSTNYLGLQTSNQPNYTHGTTLRAAFDCFTNAGGTSLPLLIGVRASAGVGQLLEGRNIVSGGTTALTSSPLRVAGLSQLSGFRWKGYAYEVLAFESYLSDADYNKLFDYLQAKWSLKDRRVFVVDGDSISNGVAASPGNSWRELLFASLSPDHWRCYNYAISGQTLAAAYAGAGALELTQGRRTGPGYNPCWIWAGTNDNAAGATDSAIWANDDAYRALAQSRGYRCMSSLMIDRGLGGPSWSLTTRNALNATKLAAAGSYDSLINPMNLDARFNNHLSNIYSADKVHPIDAGHLLLYYGISAAFNGLNLGP